MLSTLLQLLPRHSQAIAAREGRELFIHRHQSAIAPDND
jgi:hypothetical protein